ncbi:MAG: hypothetical protein M3P08_07635 [Thermoproteota archaeon]|nr:hypothetical protein [Thermoproteota archaeon]
MSKITEKQSLIKSSPISEVDKLKKSFSKKQWEVIQEHFKKKLQLQGKSTSSKSVSLISDMHVGSIYAVYSGSGPTKISPDQQKLLDWWQHCADATGKVSLLLLAGEPIDGPNRKSNAGGTWTSDVNSQLADSEKLIRMWSYDKFALCRGSRYHVEEGATSYEETLARTMAGKYNNVIQYTGLFGQALQVMQNQKGTVQDTNNGNYTDYYIFLDLHGRLLNGTHHVSFSRTEQNRSGGILRELIQMQLAQGYWYDMGRQLDILCRGHTHYFMHVETGNDQHGIINPSWKGTGDPFLFKNGMAFYPSIGSTKITVETNGKILIDKYIMPYSLAPKPKVVII